MPATRSEEIGQALRARIEALGLTQAEVARRSGIAFQNVQAILAGRRGKTLSGGTVARLAAAVEWTAEQLLGAAGARGLSGEDCSALPVDALAALALEGGVSIADLCEHGMSAR